MPGHSVDISLKNLRIWDNEGSTKRVQGDNRMTTTKPPGMDKSQPAPPSPVPKRLLLGPGPSEVDPEVLRSLSLPPLGHLDPALLDIMQELAEMLRGAFRTRNRLTLALSGTGTSGMEAALANTIEPGDQVVIGVMGYFGERLCQIVERIGGRLTRVDVPWGQAPDPGPVRGSV